MRKPPRTCHPRIAPAAWVAISLLAAATASAVHLGECFSLRPGASESVDEDRLTLTFMEVRRDNRCPTDVRCIVAGAAVVVFRAETAEPESVELTFEVPPGGSAEQSFEGFRVTLLSVDPQTHSQQRIQPEDYVARILVER